MKKQYIQPKMLLIQLTHSASLLAGSPVEMSGEEQSNDKALSRGGRYFFDDDDEE